MRNFTEHPITSEECIQMLEEVAMPDGPLMYGNQQHVVLFEVLSFIRERQLDLDAFLKLHNR